METFITVLLISLFFLPTILLVVQNTRQKIEIQKLNKRINRLMALLIAPVGIEILVNLFTSFTTSTFNRTSRN
jgi:hypothetical protein